MGRILAISGHSQILDDWECAAGKLSYEGPQIDDFDDEDGASVC